MSFSASEETPNYEKSPVARKEATASVLLTESLNHRHAKNNSNRMSLNGNGIPSRCLEYFYTMFVCAYIWYFCSKSSLKYTENDDREHENSENPPEDHVFIKTMNLQWLHKPRSAWKIHLPILLILVMDIRSIFVIILHIMIPNIADHINARAMYMYLGSPYRLLHSPTIQSEMMALCWGINALAQYFLVVHDRTTSRLFRKVNFLINLAVFYDESELRKRGAAAALGSNRTQTLNYPMANDPLLKLMRHIQLDRFRRLSKLTMSALYIFNFFMGGDVTFITLMMAYIDFWTEPWKCLYVLTIWTPIWTLYTYYCAIYAYYVFFYFLVFTSLIRNVMAEIWGALMAKNGRNVGRFQKKSLRKRSIHELMLIYNQIVRILAGYMTLWSRYITFILLCFNGCVCFNSYLFFFTHSTHYMQTMYVTTSITAFNIFFCANYFAAKMVGTDLAIKRSLFSLFARRRIGRQRFSHLKLLGCFAYEKVGIVYTDKTLLTMMTLNTVISILVMGFLLFIDLSKAVTIDHDFIVMKE